MNESCCEEFEYVTKEKYSQLNKVKKKDLDKWIKGKRLRGIVVDGSNTMLIPRNAKPLYWVRKKNGFTVSYIVRCILEALNSRRMIDAEVFGVSDNDFAQCISLAKEAGWICDDVLGYDGVENCGYRLTHTGFAFLQSYPHVEACMRAIGGVFEGIAKGVTEAVIKTSIPLM